MKDKAVHMLRDTPYTASTWHRQWSHTRTSRERVTRDGIQVVSFVRVLVGYQATV